MAMQWLERELRRTGDPQDQLSAVIIASIRNNRGADIPLPTTPLTEAEKSEIQRFSNEQREALRKEGYVVYELTGQSIASLRKQGRLFWSTWHKDYPDFEALISGHSEIAINPESLFLPGSNYQTLAEQLEAVQKFSDGLNIQRAKAILGQVPDYTELAFAHLDKTGQRLFGKEYGYNYTRTQTRVGSGVAGVGSFGVGDGLHVSYWDPGDRHDRLRAAPLVVPTGT